MSEQVERFLQEAYDTVQEENRINLDGESVPMITLEDTTKKALQSLSDAYVSLGFEESKLSSVGLRMEVRRVMSWRKTIRRLMEDVQEYRDRVTVKAPELIENVKE